MKSPLPDVIDQTISDYMARPKNILSGFFSRLLSLAFQQGVEKQASGRQPRRAAFWKAQHMH
jgi:hypothetical protein